MRRLKGTLAFLVVTLLATASLQGCVGTTMTGEAPASFLQRVQHELHGAQGAAIQNGHHRGAASEMLLSRNVR